MKVWDLHCDTLSELRRAEKNVTPASFAHNDLHIDLEKLQAGDYMLQCLAAFVNLADPTPGADPLVTALEEIDVFKRIMAKYPDRIAPVYTAADIRKNAEAGKISGLLTVEAAGTGRAHDDPDMELPQRAGSPQRKPRRAAGGSDPARPDRDGLCLSGRDGAPAHDRGREPSF